MTSLADIQKTVLSDILRRTGEALPLLATPPRGSKDDAFAVYRSAYGLRLVGFLENDFGMLRKYLGAVAFEAMARAYIAAYPSDQPNARWFSRHLPEFLTGYSPFANKPEVAELAALENACNDAFDAPDLASCTMQDLAALDPSRFAEIQFSIHPSVRRLAVTTNVTSLWSALKCDEPPPAAHEIEETRTVLVWRQNFAPRFRILGAEEDMAFGAAGDGLNFGHICEMVATMEGADDAAARAASYLRGWLEAGVISELRGDRTASSK
jgi:hypothetical protein